MKDDFWDIDKLLPRKPHYQNSPPRTHESTGSPDPVLIRNGKSNDKSVSLDDILKTVLPPANKTEIDYSSKSSVILGAVVSDIANSYSYSNDFSGNAHRVHMQSPNKQADFVPFFSYMPQYSDLSAMQYQRYLWWRECARKNEYLQTDVSYIFLYIYELISLDDVIKPENVLSAIISLWVAYYQKHTELNKYLCDWITDYAIIHNIRIPFEMLEKVIPYAETKQQSILFNMYLFDYVLSDIGHLTDDNISLVCKVLSNYSPYKSKSYEIEEYRKIFDGCIKAIFHKLFEIGFFTPDGNYLHKSELKVTRSSYLGAVCSANTKKNMAITYYPFISNELIRTSFSNIIKHTENKIRASLGMRNRLPNIILADEIRGVIDSFMELNYPVISKTKAAIEKKTAPPREIKKIEVNLAKAKRIEDISWQTTEKLTDGLIREDDETAIPIIEASVPTESVNSEQNDFPSALTECEKAILHLILNNAAPSETEKAARNAGLLADAVIDSINEKALEYIGDTVIDPSDYTVIPEYIDELSAFNI
ncbi:MAG: hypothetical protein E7588_04450 [Ruminococcaceae bacterium]|nr:hypothetical protein [Oscillospiraceae bacterium]